MQSPCTCSKSTAQALALEHRVGRYGVLACGPPLLPRATYVGRRCEADLKDVGFLLEWRRLGGHTVLLHGVT